MKSPTKRILMLFLALVAQISFAQESTITGKVTDDQGLPLPGVNIVVKNTNNGTQTDFDGIYSIESSQGSVLVFSYLGFSDKEVTVGSSTTINVQLEPSAAQLEEVVVTAQGIRREKKALGYAVSTVKSDDLEQKADTDIGKILRGKASGVRITGTGGVSGSGANIIIRGTSSITGGNQPLFVVDGVPFDGSSGGANQDASSGSFQSGNVSSRFADLDPNNIESVSILKGLSATALYGGQGRNGVILITTKSGTSARKKFEFTVNQSVFLNDIVLPDYQDTWGNGFQNVYGAFFSNWGARFDSQETIPNAFRTSINNNFDGIEPSVLFPDRPELDNPNVVYRPYDSQKAFFKTGVISTTSINASGSIGDKGSINASYAHTNDEGFIPNNSLTRNNISFGGTYKFDNKFTVSGKFNYARTNIQSPFTDASTGSDVALSTAGTGGIQSIWNILYLPRSVDINDPFQHPVTGESLWYRGGNDRTNPRWTLNNTRDTNSTDRLFSNFNVSYDLKDWLKLTYRVGLDNQNVRAQRSINKGSKDGIHPTGYLQVTNSRFTIWDHSILAGIDKQLSENFNLQGTVGGTFQSRIGTSDGVEGRDQIIFGLQNIGNYANASGIIEGTLFPLNTVSYQSYSEENNIAAYVSATVGFKDYLYLNASARNEWTSTLETANRSQFSPGVSASFIPTSAFKGIKSQNGLNFLKLRMGYGTSPGFPTPYNTRNVLSLVPNAFAGNITTTSVNNFLANPDLRPELSKEFEAGIDARFFDNRIGFEITYYNRDTEDQIIARPLAPETGFTSTFTNVGNVINEGIEITYDITPVRTENFRWNISGSYTNNQSEVKGLDEGEQILYGGIFATPANAAINGEQLGVIVGTRVLRDADGNFLIDENGEWIQDPTNGIIGDPNPKWFMTINNGIKWKNVSFNMQWEYQQGGDIYATTVGALVGRGLVEDTDFDRTQGIILPGIRQSTGQPNDIQITSTEAYFNNIGFGLDEQLIYDASHVRLREASLSYSLSDKWLKNTPFGSVSLTLAGQNLFVKAFNVPSSVNYDPELNSLGVGNSQGFDYLTSWNSRRYGMSVKLTF
ncbi:SusC/RagA family TonB-linked outer membrane protein [Aquimarina sp. 2201CG14-23]|uniref:SusC/RagA family TonB-linked outer membrane protein n=1 Tax=Aquimarina mycalae TaxID=3040073 RepID=UPI0024782581|nr:SusC/RagA family TonB-linked outer membrane protein [Aquimarina sp. 2201CG14-23]MDH7444775.1 SusC/RagA family TonB-linked outer membrane protein [Aquimarina sp. 2201CG14-23]